MAEGRRPVAGGDDGLRMTAPSNGNERPSSQRVGAAQLAGLRRRYKVTVANNLGPYPVPCTTTTVSWSAVAATLLLTVTVTAPLGAALALAAGLMLLPLRDERLREQWTWTAWLGTVIGSAVGVGYRLARRGAGWRADGWSLHVAVFLVPALLVLVFVTRNARGQSGGKWLRLIGLSGIVAAGVTLILWVAVTVWGSAR